MAQSSSATARARLVEALKAKSWGVSKLHEEAGVACTRTSLHRKLHGYRKGRRRVYQPISSLEYRQLARALGSLTEQDEQALADLDSLDLRGAA